MKRFKGSRTLILFSLMGLLLVSTIHAAPLEQETDPYEKFTVEYLAQREYGGGAIQLERELGRGNNFTRYLMSYPSDGLEISGFINIPTGEGPFPVIIAIHGYVEREIYTTLDYTTRYADELANAGYLVLHPNLRGFPPSDNDDGTDMFRVGLAVDVLNLIGLVQQGAVPQANADQIGLWGHSMGGGVSIRVLTVNPDVRAAVLYGSMSADEMRNYEQILAWSGGFVGRKELETPSEIVEKIAPVHHLDRIQAIVSIHHGEADQIVPLEWSLDFCRQLQIMAKLVECYTYQNQPHTFRGEADRLFIERTIAFYDAWLTSP